jgi:hypothetical protein
VIQTNVKNAALDKDWFGGRAAVGKRQYGAPNQKVIVKLGGDGVAGMREVDNINQQQKIGSGDHLVSIGSRDEVPVDLHDASREERGASRVALGTLSLLNGTDEAQAEGFGIDQAAPDEPVLSSHQRIGMPLRVQNSDMRQLPVVTAWYGCRLQMRTRVAKLLKCDVEWLFAQEMPKPEVEQHRDPVEAIDKTVGRSGL